MFSDTWEMIKQTRLDKTSRVHHELEPQGSYRIDNYDKAAAFSSFLPGIGGPDGIPLWCMYTNRAQAVVSFGVANKDNAIAEFLPATWAYQIGGVQGFRTFCKVNGLYYEPFQTDLVSAKYKYQRSMWIEADQLKISETNQTLGLNFSVGYFSPVNQVIASLVRILTISNHSTEIKHVSCLDGLALILPAGLTDYGIKAMRHINEAYASMKLSCGKVPYYSAKVIAHDEAEVVKVRQGNFYAAWICDKQNLIPVEPYVDPDIIFGGDNDLITPRRFISQQTLDRDAQVWENRLPCSLAPFQAELKPGQEVTLVALIGHAPTEKILANFLPNFTRLEDIQTASAQSKKLIASITSPAFTLSHIPLLDAYTRQNYLDNVLRGGIPKLLPSRYGATLLYLYSRRHGDMERDYNYFELPPHPLSTGPGNYRDICQNGRHNIWFYPHLLDQEIRMYVELLQADGYNPLSVVGYRWCLNSECDPLQLCPTNEEKAREEFCDILQRCFHPGEILAWADRHEVDIDNRDHWLEKILLTCETNLVAHGYEGGYWIDHWTYITDMLEAFASIYPDRTEEMLSEKADIGWFDEGAYVQPRKDKYLLRPGGPLQLNAVIDGSTLSSPMPRVTVFAKLCALLAIKAVSFDYECKAIEMEAGRPGWNDSLNGLPGLFGSSTCEAAEALRLARWLRDHLPQPPQTAFPEEVADFIENVIEDLKQPQYNWNRSADIRETFRLQIRKQVSGKLRKLDGISLVQLLAGIEKRARWAIEKSINSATGLIHTYYRNHALDVKPQLNPNGSNRTDPKKGSVYLTINKFSQEPLPLFLEGQVHLLRLLDNPRRARKIYQNVRNSTLFDTSLKMYKLNEALTSCPAEIGRARTFSQGWFENESVWLHMSHKYLLELLRCGLTEEFFDDARTMLVPFMDPIIYGRSVLENSSFIASSANPDPQTHGRGFIARLSGTTAEFIHIWLLLTVGSNPFYMENDELRFRLNPTLPGEWFTKEPKAITWREQHIDIPENTFTCAFLGEILLIYHNPSRANTFGDQAVRPARYSLDGQEKIQNSSMSPEIASLIRQRKCSRIDVWLQQTNCNSQR
ncbi:MAG: hypothetical protein JW860_13695 [Sedimentisphaerales bacterium]|nr:hypothetical protein [Sedimentisphaerales bacterium]